MLEICRIVERQEIFESVQIEEIPCGPFPETYVPVERDGDEGLYFAEDSEFACGVAGASPSLSTWDGWYQAPLWLRQGDVMTLWRRQFYEEDDVEYDRYDVFTPDGGVVALDVAVETKTLTPPPFDGTVPTVILLHGADGNSQDAHLINMAGALIRRGYCVAALNMRGCGNSELKTPRLFSLCRGATDDVRLVVSFIRQTLFKAGRLGAEAQIVLLGWCAGASIAVNTLAEQTTGQGRGHCGVWSWINAGVALATPHDVQRVFANLETGAFMKQAYNAEMAKALLELVAPAEKLFSQGPVPQWPDGKKSFFVDVDKLKASKIIRHIDEVLTSKMFAYDSVEDYYYDASSFRRLAYIRVPLLLMNSADDPVVTGWVPINEVRSNPNLILAYTGHGGHMVWHDVDNHRRSRWVEAVACEFLDAVVQDQFAL